MLCSFLAPSPQVFAFPFHRYPQKMKIDSYDTVPLRWIYFIELLLHFKILRFR
ncbi:hypothetical protein BCE_2478 [Bacillus cereus ATCC 10987]|uniref:Uncharacterized protein n=1 Tax=Bacillus cereus (strain ATCC 10987 / NRS 248) TaxID=222523 RepID=Q738B7_BACC1|nr:hypothetical protein BCE_2478 [Bacillus cereus ATCC 10987]